MSIDPPPVNEFGLRVNLELLYLFGAEGFDVGEAVRDGRDCSVLAVGWGAARLEPEDGRDVAGLVSDVRMGPGTGWR